MNFHVSVTTDTDTGEFLAVYFQVRKGRSVETREFGEGVAFADYDRQGRLLGFEALAPCSVTILDQIVEDEPTETRSRAKKFVRDNAPGRILQPA